jgi:hypothetical protein
VWGNIGVARDDHDDGAPCLVFFSTAHTNIQVFKRTQTDGGFAVIIAWLQVARAGCNSGRSKRNSEENEKYRQ